MSIVKDVLELLESGYRPYTGKIDFNVVTSLHCNSWSQSQWFVRETPKKRHFICLGCNNRPCVLTNPEGFEFTAEPREMLSRLMFTEVRAITPQELLQAKKWFRVSEAAFILNISEAKIRRIVDEGILIRHKDLPVRISMESLREEFEKEDW